MIVPPQFLLRKEKHRYPLQDRAEPSRWLRITLAAPPQL